MCVCHIITGQSWALAVAASTWRQVFVGLKWTFKKGDTCFHGFKRKFLGGFQIIIISSLIKVFFFFTKNSEKKVNRSILSTSGFSIKQLQRKSADLSGATAAITKGMFMCHSGKTDH